MIRLPGVTMIILALALASCGAAPTDSGISGLVTLGPISPVEQPGVPNDAPYQATIVVEDVSGDTVATVHSAEDGRFAVALAPGDYVLVPQSPGQLPFAEPQQVTVEPHRFTEVTVAYDSGIR